jgi:hypothetical protein
MRELLKAFAVQNTANQPKMEDWLDTRIATKSKFHHPAVPRDTVKINSTKLRPCMSDLSALNSLRT